ncbi:MAG: hypothetical protein JEY79_19020 [Pseudodesulfovibrio sp.]|nr:hypothetical protein [Pseudodesulfovibrio sp.]
MAAEKWQITGYFYVVSVMRGYKFPYGFNERVWVFMLKTMAGFHKTVLFQADSGFSGRISECLWVGFLLKM